MKRFFKGILAFSCAATMLFAFSCGDVVKNGSKIDNCKITLNYVDADGEEQTRTINFELYVNYAPATVEHFEYLANQGYYDGTVVSNLSSYVEFGAFTEKDGVLTSKYDENVEKGYYSIITKDYALNKYVGTDKSVARYADDFSIHGEFAENGFGGNKLGLTGGSLVLKRDYNAKNQGAAYNTGKGTMAVTFGSSTYISTADRFAVIGKILSDDDDQFEDEQSSLEFLQALMTELDADADDNSYWYYGKADSEYVGQYGRYLMKDENGTYFVKDASGKFTVELDDTDDEDFLKELSEQAVYMNNLPYHTITIVSVKIG